MSLRGNPSFQSLHHPRNNSVFKPLVSIIIPCYQSLDYIADSIHSALAQTHERCEVIVIDDGSTDGSLDVIRTFSDRIRWEAGPNAGAPAARNRGLRLARGELVKFLDADDVLLPDAISRQVEQMASCPEDVIPYGLALDHESGSVVWDRVQTSGVETKDETILQCYKGCILISCPLHRARVLRSIGGFDEELKRGQEWNLHLRLALAGHRFRRHPDPVFQYRAHAGESRISNTARVLGVSNVLESTIHNTLRLLTVHYSGELPTSLKAVIHNHLQELARSAAEDGCRTAARAWHRASMRYHVPGVKAGSPSYRCLSQLVGWYQAARIAKVLRPMFRRAARTQPTSSRG